ncbi:hypothetical protein OG883_45690 [Streptomyces sp. NBC_01142]|uniref:hypothetical protein n=1 Tax=Streptomyces sp. NBC_01142 TaxID=2975865 RepID=UPI002251F4A6|nr:hypothetical protein [Streptomyces sp. NBC_01142]MCX4826933.1 hypothetical protein [Streptomyces sp. NBC_01142]
MTQPAAASLSWKALMAGAAACVFAAAAVPHARGWLAVTGAALGLGAVAVYGRAQVAAGRPCAAVAWMAAGCVAGILAWGLGEQHYPLGYAVAAFQLLVGAVLLPRHLRLSGRPAARPRGSD